MNPYQVTTDFEASLCDYTGAPYAVAVNSCTAALHLTCKLWLEDQTDKKVCIPKNTYCSVPMSIIHAGGTPVFQDKDWRGAYQLEPLPIFDCARRFTSGMYVSGQYQCVSFSAAKILGVEQGGAILHDNVAADKWFRRMRFDGRQEGVHPLDENFTLVGHHCIMLPSTAGQALLRLHHLPDNNEDMPDYPYPELSQHSAFK